MQSVFQVQCVAVFFVILLKNIEEFVL